MKKALLLIFVFAFLFICPQVIKAIEIVNLESVKLNIYGKLYGDFFYSYANNSLKYREGYFGLKPDIFAYNQGKHSFGSYASVGSSRFGFEVEFGKATAIIEFGISDIMRRILVRYDFDKENNHYLQIGKDTVLSYYNFGQVSNDFQSLIGYGTLSDLRRFAIRYGYEGLHIALIMPFLGGIGDDPAPSILSEGIDELNLLGRIMQEARGDIPRTLYTGLQTFRAIPGLELAYTSNIEGLWLKVFASYRPYYSSYINDYKAVEESFLVHSANAGLGLDAFVGSGVIHATVWYGLNQHFVGSLWQRPSAILNNNYNGLAGNISAVALHSLGIALGIEHRRLAGFLTPALGAGYLTSLEVERRAHHYFGAYMNCKIELNDYFALIPEIALLMNLNRGYADNGFYLTVGILGEIIF